MIFKPNFQAILYEVYWFCLFCMFDVALWALRNLWVALSLNGAKYCAPIIMVRNFNVIDLAHISGCYKTSIFDNIYKNRN